MPSQRISMTGSLAGDDTHTTVSRNSSTASSSRNHHSNRRNNKINSDDQKSNDNMNKTNVMGKPKRPKGVQRQTSDYDIDYEIDAGIQAKMDTHEEESSAPYNVSWIVIALWIGISALFLYGCVILSNSFMPSFTGEDMCCGYPIELGVIPTIFYFVTMVTYLLAIIFMTLSTALVKQRECYTPLVHVCFTLSPCFEALMFWLLLYTYNKDDGMAVLIVQSVRIVLQLVAMSMAMKNKKGGWCKGMICHIIIQFLALAATIVVYVLYVNNGGVCYVVEKEATYFRGCEVCENGYPPNEINGTCLMTTDDSSSNHNTSSSTTIFNDPTIDDENKLNKATFCSDDNVGVTKFDQNFCFFSSSSY